MKPVPGLPATSPGHATAESNQYLSRQLITYIGNKRRLLGFIGDALGRVKRHLGKTKLSVFDGFAGSGVVSRFFKQHSTLLLSNDLEEYAEVIGRCYLTNRDSIDLRELAEVNELVASRKLRTDLGCGILEGLYAPRDEENIMPGERAFYTIRNARILDNLRRTIDEIDPGYKDFLLAPLLSEASIHANTSGVFKGFYKNEHGIGQFGGRGRDALQRIQGEVTLPLPILSSYECDWRMYRRDTNALVRELPEVDVAYYDPPYNQHPYGSNYFMLNVICGYREPRALSRVSGIPAAWNKSIYNRRREIINAIDDLVSHTKARYVIISYNDEGFVNLAGFVRTLEKHGTVDVVEQNYHTFRGSRNLNERSLSVVERLYVLKMA